MRWITGELMRWITVELISRLVRRFRLEDQRRDQTNIPIVGEVMPTSNIDDLLKIHELGTATVNVGASTAVVWTVPRGKRWFLHWVFKDSTAGPTCVFLTDGLTTLLLQIPNTNPLSTPLYNIPCEPTWQIGLSQGAVGDTAIAVTLQYTEEDAY